MYQEILRRLLRKIASLRFEFRHEKARRYPFRIFDRTLEKSVAQFEIESDARRHLTQLIDSFVQENYDAIDADPSLWLNANDRGVPNLFGELTEIPGKVPLPAL